LCFVEYGEMLLCFTNSLTMGGEYYIIEAGEVTGKRKGGIVMEERSPKNAVLQTVKTVLIVLAVFAAAILYIFVSSAVQGKNYKGKTSDMYGRDSLEYVGEPVMKISVWQANGKPENSRYLGASSYFFDLVPLTLKKGEKVSTEKDIFDDIYTSWNLITIEYDGEIFGEYEIKVRNQLRYSGSKEAVPGVQYEGNSGGKTGSAPVFYQEDSSFTGNKVVTLDIKEMIRGISYAQLTGQGYYEAEWLLKNYNIDVNDYLTTEKLHDIYPDAPEELKDVYRDVFTTHVTIHARHPTKTDVTVATAVLAVRQISSWKGFTVENHRILRESKRYGSGHTEIVVESYTQSDMFAFE